MLPFIISFLAVIIISMCFTKKRFWEYRYIVLIIGVGVALIATLTVNYSLRSKLPTKIEVVNKENLQQFYMPDSLPPTHVDSLNNVHRMVIIKNYDYYALAGKEFEKKNKGENQIPTEFILYNTDNRNYFGFVTDGHQCKLKLSDFYFEENIKDTIPSYCEKIKKYNVDDNNWVSDISLPHISRIKIISLPSNLYAMIPDSLISKAPY